MTDESKLEAFGAVDKAKLWIAVLVATAGVAAYYLLGTQAEWLRWLCVLGGLAAAALVVWFSSYGSEFSQFVTSARVELRKIVWPNRHETGMTTLVVFVFVIIAALFFWGLDVVLAWATKALTGQGG